MKTEKKRRQCDRKAEEALCNDDDEKKIQDWRLVWSKSLKSCIIIYVCRALYMHTGMGKTCPYIFCALAPYNIPWLTSPDFSTSTFWSVFSYNPIFLLSCPDLCRFSYDKERKEVQQWIRQRPWKFSSTIPKSSSWIKYSDKNKWCSIEIYCILLFLIRSLWFLFLFSMVFITHSQRKSYKFSCKLIFDSLILWELKPFAMLICLSVFRIPHWVFKSIWDYNWRQKRRAKDLSQDIE